MSEMKSFQVIRTNQDYSPCGCIVAAENINDVHEAIKKHCYPSDDCRCETRSLHSGDIPPDDAITTIKDKNGNSYRILLEIQPG